MSHPFAISNMSAIRAHARLARADRRVAFSIERVTSGRRINRAADDAAGLAIANDMRAETLSLKQAQRNASHAISILQIAEGALASIEEILVRMKELAVQRQSANTSDDGRGMIDAEIAMLRAEIDRIAVGTNYQDRRLLDGSYEGVFLIDMVDGSGDYLSLTLGDVRQETLLPDPLTDANRIDSIDAALEQVWSAMSSVGALVNRVEMAEGFLREKIVAMQSSEATIRDLDYAGEVTELMSAAIIRKAGLSMLAQANASSEALLALLPGNSGSLQAPSSGGGASPMDPNARLSAHLKNNLQG